MKLGRYKEGSKPVAICDRPTLFGFTKLGYDGQVGFTKLEYAKLPVKEKECNRKVAPLKQRFSTRCNRMAVSDAVCVI
jgi:hypothetical protein